MFAMDEVAADVVELTNQIKELIPLLEEIKKGLFFYFLFLSILAMNVVTVTVIEPIYFFLIFLF